MSTLLKRSLLAALLLFLSAAAFGQAISGDLVGVVKDSTGDETTTNQAWFNGAGDLIKVATEKTASGRRELTEYFATTKIEEWQPMFILTRKETTQSDNSVQVDESRQYFDGNADVIRELRKSGHFKPGESLDTVHVKNVAVNLSKKLKDEQSDVEKAKARNAFYQKPAEIAAALKQSGPPVSDPFANVTGDSEKYRVIQNSISPDGRYALSGSGDRTGCCNGVAAAAPEGAGKGTTFGIAEAMP